LGACPSRIRLTAKQTNATILLVDDFDPWRAILRNLLSQRRWTIVAEASDGPGAVRKASELRPDIVTLDIGLPGFDRIEAARLIRRQSPDTSIVFLTQLADDDIRETALAAGGVAYVLKARVTTDLIPAIERAQAAATSDRQPVSISSRT